jgi:phosphoribosylaminoimidazole-succinocarboxamide synthase
MKLHARFFSLFFIRRISRKDKTARRAKQLSKEFVRRWLIQNGFQGLGTINSDMSDEYIETI